ncbi:MAG TPA: helix-turn-helix domain-containing protein [Planctomycetota bacterium]|nr:helix-turn-helix domain-containing protein [Planctomycetota bacterium]
MRDMAQSDLRRVERAARKRKEAIEELRVAIVLARAAGETQADVARAAGLSPQRIAQIERGE